MMLHYLVFKLILCQLFSQVFFHWFISQEFFLYNVTTYVIIVIKMQKSIR